MRINLLTDSNWEAKLDHAIRPLQIRHDFEERDYGPSLQKLIIVLNCRDPSLGHKQRVRFSRSKAQLNMDVMLPLDAMIKSNHAEHRPLVARCLREEVDRVLGDYSFDSFDAGGFLLDFTATVDNSMLGSDADRFDHLCRP